MPTNDEVAQRLDEMARLMDLLGEDSFRASAHARAARAVSGLVGDINELAKDRAKVLAQPR